MSFLVIKLNMPYKDPEKRREHDRKYRDKNREKERARQKERAMQENYQHYQKEYRERNREKAKQTTSDWVKSDNGRNKTLLNKYGITLEQYDAMLIDQDYLCAICKQPEQMLHKEKPKRLCVDHDHKTGKVRGLLCQRCNTTLGRYEDNPELMKNLISYLLESFT